MQWKENYSTGNEEIDEQHKTLFAFSDDFRSSLEDGFGLRTYEGYVEFLSVYSKTHFDFEDKCMLAHKCPVAPRNRAEHKTFAKLVTEENEAY
ncbi:hemerythrin domain-containing protein [Pseudohalocynthiibacter sp. F2068]|jgi:hemerythrin|uniref:bacteriohemerythrin n=1 Tax=Pseudohalocynthiibacter sp. F2068 TaxID=2926418 RepID=UPI001FF19E59|nr:hemerythrin domain-containing protein [Pseudohalocynthiibacter sp. F2068]MCK0101193.1 hypothetical protein [Pseudohalocynthiibacter sp. F2068]